MATRDVVVSSLVAAGVAAGVYFGLAATRKSADTVDVPPLVGLRVEQARAMLDPRGLLLVLAEEREDPRFPAGQICEQHPLEGSSVHRGDSVSVSVAKASATVKVPDVTNETLNEAKLRLEVAKLTAGRVTEQINATAAAGTVVGQGAAPGTEVHAGAAIDLIVSKGPETAAVPSVTGRSSRTAKDLLTQAGFVTGNIKYKSDEDRSDGVVLEQVPAAGVVAPKGSKVDLVVNSLD